MRNTTDTFSFDIPDSWEVFMEDRRFVAQGPEGEELILSSWAPMPRPGSTGAGLDQVLAQLVANAKSAAERTAADPDLTITKPLGPDEPAGGIFPCWTLLSEAPDESFCQAVIQGPSAVMLATYEAPLSPHRVDEFKVFLRSFETAESRA